jgi:hypothetical protein
MRRISALGFRISGLACVPLRVSALSALSLVLCGCGFVALCSSVLTNPCLSVLLSLKVSAACANFLCNGKKRFPTLYSPFTIHFGCGSAALCSSVVFLNCRFLKGDGDLDGGPLPRSANNL